jgi:uncharacterized protein (DUF885 family)
VSWTPFADEQETTEENHEFVEQQIATISNRMADLAKQMELYDSDDYAWFQTYLENFKERVKSEAIVLDDPIKHAEKRATYQLLTHLIALPHTTDLEYRSLREQLETLRPEHAGTLS